MDFINLLETNPTLVPITLGFIVACFGILYQRKTARETNSLKFQSDKAHNKEYEKHSKTAMVFCNTASSKDLEELARDHTIDDAGVAILYILNEWERCASAVEHKLYDESFIFKSSASGFINMVNKLMPYINETRSQTGKKTVYSNMMAMHERWVMRRKIDSYFSSIGIKKNSWYYTSFVLKMLLPVWFFLGSALKSI
ncbi:DUF4760 domain-containing protein [Vibrio gigantis]|uniref:DUF4760 domain-containing protein n=1 Tax=Vibrio gigantis TaxID=296199 RepID=UPI003D1300E8